MILKNQNIIENKIISLLKNKKKLSGIQIAKEIKHNRITVIKYLEILKANGIIEYEDIAQAKLWFLSEKTLKKNILVVDDEPHIVNLIKLSLKNNTNEIIEAYSGFEALEKVKNNKIDLIILDLMMPNLNGFEVCRKLKSNAITQHIPIIILSAKNELEDKMRGINLGADDYITKPFDPIEFEARINSVIFSSEKNIEFNNLTGLPSKNALISYLNNSKENNFFIYKIFIDNLKLFNKKYGFKKNNELLLIISRMLNDKLSQDENSRIYHLINDVFIILTYQKDFVKDINSSFERLLPFICANLKDNSKIKLNIELINKSIKFNDINRIIKKIDGV
jgi:two-component system, OmpR family, alkaline phosphatase synthesis response regulator PhoP